MKNKLQLLTLGILFPVLMYAQLTMQGGKARLQTHVLHSLSKSLPQPSITSSLAGFYREGFEGNTFPPAGWQVIDVLNNVYNWEQAYAFPFSGLNSAYIGYGNNPGEDWLILPQFTVTATDSFSFWLAAEFTDFPPDSTFILVSTSDSDLVSFTSVLGTLAEGDNYPTIPFVYQQYSFPLSAFAGNDIYIAIKNKNIFGDGLLFDRVDIGTKPALNATSFSIDLNKFIPTNFALTPTATFQNDGNSMQSFPVTMTITDGYTSTKNVSNLAPGASQQISFDPWTSPATTGTEIVSVQTQLIGDGYAADDSMNSSIKVMEPFTNYGWSSRAPISPARMEVPITAINSNDTSYLFAMGGNTTLNSGGSAYDQAMRYLPFSDSWDSLATMLYGASAACAGSYNNKVYVFGGYNAGGLTDQNRMYDVANNIWSLGAGLPNATAGAAFGVYHDSLFYVIGGNNGTSALSDVQIYNAASDTWTIGSSLPFAFANMGGGISGNKIVVSGGLTTLLGVIDANDPGIITWSTVDDYPGGPSSGLIGFGSLDAASGLIIFTGGGPEYSNSYGSDATFAYDLNTNQWKVGPPKPSPVILTNMTAVVDNDSLYLVAAGGYGSGSLLDVNEWLNMGPYVITTGVSTNDPFNINISCSPNPFENDVEIKFSLSQASTVNVSIVDMMGRKVEVLSNTYLQAGKQKLKWNASKYSKGIYFCKLVINGQPSAQKLLKN